MLIVSQEKDKIINFSRMNLIKIEPSEDKFDIEIDYTDDFDIIGTYESFERAKEILEAIIQEFRKVARVEKEKGQPKFYKIPRVYEMPEK